MLYPRARKSSLLSKELDEEWVVYDLERDEAHCLNASAAIVWRHCDGETSVAALAKILRETCDPLADEETIQDLLAEFEQANLLEPGTPVPDLSRRRAFLKAGAVAAAALAVMSIKAPNAQAAASKHHGPTPTPSSSPSPSP